MDLTPVHTLNLTGVLAVSKRIILAIYWHFITLSIFFLPLSSSLIINPTFDPSNHQKFVTYYIIYTLIIYILTLCAIYTITYTTHHAFFGSQVKILDAFKSLTTSFFRLASTAIIAHVLIVLISLTFFLLIETILMVVHSIGFVIDYNSTYFMWFSAIACVFLIAIVVYVHVEWSLAFAVVVVESKWGFEALMRSTYLVKGMRSVSLLVLLYFGVFGASIVFICSANQHTLLVNMLCSFFLMMFLLRITAANTVLYNYCKALHGELTLEVEYMNLPADDDGFEQESMSFPP